MIKFLTQNNCGQCMALKTYLDKGLKGQYDQYIEVVHKDEQADEFMKLVKEHQIIQTPALIAENGQVLRGFSVSEVKPFLEKNITK